MTTPESTGSVQRTADRGAAKVREAKDLVTERTADKLSEGKGRLADQVGSLGTALRRTSEQLRTEQRGGVARVTDAVAQRADRVAEYLRQTDGETVRQDLEDLARRQPAAVLGAAFALGLLGARFLKSSGRGGDAGDTPMSPGAGGGYGGA